MGAAVPVDHVAVVALLALVDHVVAARFFGAAAGGATVAIRGVAVVANLSGVLDVIATGNQSNEIVWYENQRPLGMVQNSPSLVRHKVLIGDPEPEVMTECYASLLRLGHDNVEFVGPFLHGDTRIAECAALVFREARIEGSELVLIEAAKDSLNKKVINLALAMMQTKASIDHLLLEIEAGDDSAIEALEIYRHDATLMARIAEFTSKRA